MTKLVNGEDTKVSKLKLSERYPLVPLLQIEIAERPDEGSDDGRLFYNPRSIESMTDEDMESLRISIAKDSLNQPPIVRIFTVGGERTSEIERIELVAGERRIRSLLYLYEENTVVKDFDGQFRPAQEVYKTVPCRVLYNISDEEALHIAQMENLEREAPPEKDMILLVERLTHRGLNQDQIAYCCNKNVTWVSQTANFRHELPPEAFEKLWNGTLARNVAVQLLSYKKADRSQVFEAATMVQEEEFKTKFEELELAIERAEDTEEIEREKSIEADDDREAVRAKKRAEKAAKTATELREKKERTEKEGSTIRQGHIKRGATLAGITPRKAKALDKQSIEQQYIDLTEVWIRNEKVDPLTGYRIPSDILEEIRITAEAIVSGEQDPLVVARKIMARRGLIEEPVEPEPELVTDEAA